MQLIAPHLVREFTKYEFHSLSDLAEQLKADYFGVVPMEIEMENEKGPIRKKVVYMAYVKEDRWSDELQYLVIITFSFLEKEEVWTCVTEENHQLYMPALEAMLGLYEKQDFPDLLEYDFTNVILLWEDSKVTDDFVRDAVISHVEEHTCRNGEDDIPF